MARPGGAKESKFLPEGYDMYDDESPMRADAVIRAEPDERIGMMQAFVQADDKLYALNEDLTRLQKDIALVREQRANLLGRISDALGISGSENKSDAALDSLRERLRS